MTNFVIFDIDGVLNSEIWYKSKEHTINKEKDLDPKCIERLNKICSQTGAFLVMSSDWRYDYENSCLRLYRSGLHGFIADKTPLSIFSSKELSRGNEIQNWINENLRENENYCIIDDRTDMLPNQPFFEINPKFGLTDNDVEKIINYFKNLEN